MMYLALGKCFFNFLHRKIKNNIRRKLFNRDKILIKTIDTHKLSK